MAENTNMGPERINPGNVTEIQIDNSMHFTGQDLERMRQTDVPGGGTQLESLGVKSRYPEDKPEDRPSNQPKFPTEIEYITYSPLTKEDIEHMKQTNVEGGGTQLEHFGECSSIPQHPSIFERVAHWIEIKKVTLKRHGRKGIKHADVEQLASTYENSPPEVRSRMWKDAQVLSTKLGEPIPETIRGRRI